MRRLAPALVLLLGACSEAPVMSYMRTDGPAADPVTTLGWALTGVALAVVLLVGVLVLWASLRRTDERTDQGESRIVEPAGNGLRWIYIGVPVTIVILVAFFVWTSRVTVAVYTPRHSPTLTLDVTGHQWWWEVQYRGRDPGVSFLTANEIHIPVGEPVEIRLSAADVIHSFWVPKLAGKTDLIPGQRNVMWIQADRPGVYRGQCGEYCGLQHATMAMYVVAHEPAEFRAWWAGQLRSPPPPATPITQAGLQVFQRSCAACHAVRGTGALGRLGPDLTHLMTRRTIAAGILPNTRGNLAGWISDAQGIKPGSRMPTIGLLPQDLHSLLAYLETLD